jgi:hypothetical protein
MSFKAIHKQIILKLICSIGYAFSEYILTMHYILDFAWKKDASTHTYIYIYIYIDKWKIWMMMWIGQIFPKHSNVEWQFCTYFLIHIFKVNNNFAHLQELYIFLKLIIVFTSVRVLMLVSLSIWWNRRE